MRICNSSWGGATRHEDQLIMMRINSSWWGSTLHDEDQLFMKRSNSSWWGATHHEEEQLVMRRCNSSWGDATHHDEEQLVMRRSDSSHGGVTREQEKQLITRKNNTPLSCHIDHGSTVLGQYNSPGEYCGPGTASSVFLILVSSFRLSNPHSRYTCVQRLDALSHPVLPPSHSPLAVDTSQLQRGQIGAVHHHYNLYDMHLENWILSNI